MLQKTTRLFDTLVVDQERMRGNLALSQRLVFSGAVLLALVDHGMLRDDAYRWCRTAPCALARGRRLWRAHQERPRSGRVLRGDIGRQAMDPDQ